MKATVNQCAHGAAVGSPEFVEVYLKEKVASWTRQVKELADVASTEPHAAYAAFVFDFSTMCDANSQ